METTPDTPYTLDTIRDLRILQHRDGYRFSMDAVFLADFVNLRVLRDAADFGAGSGVVGMLLARRYPDARVTLVELQEGLSNLSERNIKENALEGRVRALRADVREPGELVELSGLDLVVSNPPFRKPLSGRLSKGDEKAIARHELELDLKGLMSAAARVLKARGKFAFVHLPERLGDVMETCRAAGLEPKRLRFVHGRQGAEARMVLVEAVRGGRASLKVETPLFVYEGSDLTREARAMYEI